MQCLKKVFPKYVLKPMALSFVQILSPRTILLLLIAPLSPLTLREAYRFVEGVINSGPPRMLVFTLFYNKSYKLSVLYEIRINLI